MPKGVYPWWLFDQRPFADVFDEKVDRSGDHHLWIAGTGNNGYGAIKRAHSETQLAHRVAWELRSGKPVPAGGWILHTCDVKLCVRSDDEGTYDLDGVSYPRFGHLWLGDNAANRKDRDLKGRSRPDHQNRRRGEDCNLSQFSEREILTIQTEWQTGTMTQSELAQVHGTTQQHISRIVNGKVWVHLTETRPKYESRKTTRLRGRPTEPIKDRLEAKQLCGLTPDDCYDWLASRHTFGYGLLQRGVGKSGLAHRISWEVHFGPIPQGMWLLHKCDNPPCSNPRHLFLGTIEEGIADTRAKKRLRNKRDATGRYVPNP